MRPASGIDVPGAVRSVEGGRVYLEKTILIVDDDQHLGDGMGRILRRSGCRVTVCVSGDEALKRIEQERFDIIITDYQMPVMDGVELTRRLRARSFTETIIGMSCYEAGEEFHRAGADGFFRKPLMPEMLHHFIVRRVEA